MEGKAFTRALEAGRVEAIERIPKSDLHSHAGRGGSLRYIERWANVRIDPPTEPFDSLAEMNQWLNDHVKCHCPGFEGYLKRVEAAFAQATADSIAVLALSFHPDEIAAFGGINGFTAVMDGLHRRYAPNTVFLPDLSLGASTAELRMLDEIFSARWFHGIDIINYTQAYSMRSLKAVCHKARGAGLILKAHVGELGCADDVLRYAEELALDQIQHGVLAVQSEQAMRWLADHKIQLNICPTSNVMLKIAKDYRSHPIRTLYEHGVPITVNTDDLLIFNSTASQEYIKLYDAGCLSAEALNTIRETGLGKRRSSSSPRICT